jgi:hypothetical protein
VKTWSITLSLLCAAGIALADDNAPAPAPAVQPEAAAVAVTEKAAPAKPKHHRAAWKAKRLPRGDLRKCLELKDNMAIIQCAENRRNN